MNITIVGTGYVGLVTAAVFADFGYQVNCLDIDEDKINSLKHSKIPFYEPGLAEIVKKNFDKKRLIFTTDYKQALKETEIIFICVGTPTLRNGKANLNYLFSAVEQIAKDLTQPALIVLKSTVPVGVEKELQKTFQKHSKLNCEFASCPEFLREGSAIEDTLHPSRIIIGAESKKAADLLLKLFEPFKVEKIITSIASAQIIKYASNSFLATKISFANLIADLSEKLDADVTDVLKGVGLDPRIGTSFLYPGAGYGGSCFPKDVSAFITILKKNDLDANLLEATQKINSTRIQVIIKKIKKHFKSLQGKNITILGLSFKPNTDDIREAPSIKIIEELLSLGAKINAYDPIAQENVKKVFNSQINYSPSVYQAVKNSDCLVIVTEWNEFKELELEKVKKLMKNSLIIDGRNMYDPDKVGALGFTYEGIGRK